MHPSLGLLSEIERWTRKQCLINNLLEQLKSKESQNKCRDKTKFLQTIRRSLEKLTEDPHPQNCAVNILPALCDAMRTVESVSRYYTRQAYLDLIFTKVTNQLVKICGIIDDIKENFHLDKRDVKRFREVPKGSIPLETNSINESTFQRLKNCLLLQASYKEIFRTLRDALGGSQMLTSTAFSATSSSTLSETTQASGILMSQDEKIFQHFNEFCRRFEQMLDMTIILNQFSQLITTTVRLPKPKRADVIEAENIANRADARKREDEEEREEERNDNNNNVENASDEGIDDRGSDAGVTKNDYLTSTVSKTDLELMSIFDLIHKQFTSLTHEIEQLIGAYVNVMFSKTKRTHEGLFILASFEPICERNYLRSILRDAYVNLCLTAIAWSRTLLTKIEQAMNVFKLNQHIITLGNFPLISKLYNRTAKALLVYEQFLLARWKEKIDA
ncbi:unnamed protein product [Rotaria sp. Silwood1]|nr:unnamed protein product [Rotaria sp. Silwood1]CAF1626232.1 unnamed protein product [Rotaria sp. Silwood1]CAF4737125.1 unnamed protein product [Rotaria sp. Silwood1]